MFFCYNRSDMKIIGISILIFSMVLSFFFALAEIFPETSIFKSVKKEIKIEGSDDTLEKKIEAKPEKESSFDPSSAEEVKKEAASEKRSEKNEEIIEKAVKAPDEKASDFSIKKNYVDWGYQKYSGERKIDTIIIHSSFDALGDDPYDFEGLLKEYESYGVAPHYLIDRSGNIYQLVRENDIAYHAGESKVPDGRSNVNSFSIGIELMNTYSDSMTSKQYSSLNILLKDLKKKYEIKYVLGHNQIAPGRKTDPWNFNWKKLN